MHTLLSLWLPILLSAVVVFFISSLIHMVFKWHAADYHAFANEDDVRAAIRAGNPTPGRYVVPYCGDMKAMADEGMQRKYREGPIAHVVIGPNGIPNMGKYLGTWFVWTLIIAAVAGCLAGHAFAPGPIHARSAAKLVAAITFIAHGFGSVTESIWMMRRWSETARHLLDAALYAAGSGAVFLWLWP
jgi:hypothetical protein